MRMCLNNQVAMINTEDKLFYQISTMDTKIVQTLFSVTTFALFVSATLTLIGNYN